MNRADTVVEEREEQEAKNPAEAERVVPRHPDPPARHEQDTQAVEGETAMNLPPGHEMVPRGGIQG